MARLADRLTGIAPFEVMAVLARARELEAQGKSIIHMEIGEPDFPTAAGIVSAGKHALEQGLTYYTPALGLPALRAAIANTYKDLDSGRVVVTPGASGALQLIMAALINPGDEVLMADPGYPCNRHFVHLYSGVARTLAVGPDSGYQLTADLIAEHWSAHTRAVVLVSPANPSGTMIKTDEMRRIAEYVAAHEGVLIVDETYLGLVYDAEAITAAGLPGEVFVVNSFSKYQGMTGWRLGWMVAPGDYIGAIDKLAQNLFIAAPTVAQYAALSAFEAETIQELERRRLIFKERRDYLLPALRGLGFEIPVTPEGAFYLYADCSSLGLESRALADALLEQAGVAITPGQDFGEYRAREHVRFSYANTLEHLRQGVDRIEQFLEGRELK
ncbi:MAG: pyridoxal phosphate-dependent aminotransferase [Gammaproteobacteria bacterium]|nr:MAG: pyridoxal phosphate-dependent aminotransferase [Gammaproteobacteria bacterium]